MGVTTNVWNLTPGNELGPLAFATTGGTFEVFFACSARASVAPAQIGVQLTIADVTVTAQIWTNDQNHRTLVPASFVVELLPGTYPISVNPIGSTMIDQYEFFTLTLRQL